MFYWAQFPKIDIRAYRSVAQHNEGWGVGGREGIMFLLLFVLLSLSFSKISPKPAGVSIKLQLSLSFLTIRSQLEALALKW